MITLEIADYIIRELHSHDWRNWEDPNTWVSDVVNGLVTEPNNKGCDMEGYAE